MHIYLLQNQSVLSISNGKHCNVEVQKADDDDHFRRVRYNASCITANITEPGVKFENVPDLYMIYITEKDILKGRQTIYYAQQCILDSRQPIDDGLHIIYVNTAIDDETLIAELMKNFLKTSVNSVKFPKLSEGVSYYKNNREGQRVMCSALAEAIAEERAIAEAIGEARGGGIKAERRAGFSDEEILTHILEDTDCTEEQARELMQEH